MNGLLAYLTENCCGNATTGRPPACVPVTKAERIA